MLISPNFQNMIIGTTALADGTVVGIAPPSAESVQRAPEVETSKEAVVHFEDTTPFRSLPARKVPGSRNADAQRVSD